MYFIGMQLTKEANWKLKYVELNFVWLNGCRNKKKTLKCKMKIVRSNF